MAEEVQVREGTTEFWAPAHAPSRGPRKKGGGPFYNPAMRLARDVSVLVARAFVQERGAPVDVCDAMASLGARGLRIAAEVPGTRVLLNDLRPESADWARRNASSLGLANVEVRTGRLEGILTERSFDWVDIDPFGTPAPFLDVSVAAVRDRGIWAVTATDKASLCGVYPDVCLRRYGSRPTRSPMMWETATRILLYAMARAAQGKGRSLQPLLTHSTNHYVRAYVRVHAAAATVPAGYAWLDGSLERGVSVTDVGPETSSGPLWTGPILDPDFMKRVQAQLGPTTPVDVRRRIGLLLGEVGAAPLYHTIDEWTRRLHVNAPRLDALIEQLRATGHRASRTHFTPRGFKTDASAPEIEAALRATV